MAAPAFARIDHVHVFVRDRAAATAWYARVLGLRPEPAFVHWASDGGPLTLVDACGAVHIALFERTPQPNRATVAFGVAGPAFEAWQAHLDDALGADAVQREDHGLSLSVYFSDPDGNPYEITTYEVEGLR